MVGWRLAGLILLCVELLLRYGWARSRTGRGDLRRMQARWVHESGARLCRFLRVEWKGEEDRPLPEGLIVCNHVGYLDILVIAAHFPCAFVSKAEVRDWPLFGWLARAGGSLFLRRESRTATREMAAAMRERLARGERLVVFPEGTSSDGSGVLPFRPALFAAAMEAGAAVVPAALSYEVEEGTVAEEVAYWGEMTLLPHVCRLLGKGGIRARLVWGEPLEGAVDRKQLAVESRERVVGLLAEARGVSVGVV